MANDCIGGRRPEENVLLEFIVEHELLPEHLS